MAPFPRINHTPNANSEDSVANRIEDKMPVWPKRHIPLHSPFEEERKWQEDDVELVDDCDSMRSDPIPISRFSEDFQPIKRWV